MSELLLELFSEEIPARMQERAVLDLNIALVNELVKVGFSAPLAHHFVTPRRLAIWLKDLPVEQAATESELKGPKVGAPEAALQGFLKKSGLARKDLVERDGVYFAYVKKEGRKTADVLKTIIEEILSNFPWPKSMRWGDGNISWVRPLHSILCIFDGNVIPVSFAGITAGNSTRGHRFLAPASITITSAKDYEPALEKAFVIADREVRKAKILAQAEAIAKEKGLVLKNDQGLLEEVTGLVEFPTLLAGKIDAKYMDLPKEVLISEMRAHQKYFALENKDGTLSDIFLITSNMKTSDEGKAIIAGNERVLRARLADGRFFWDQDRKKRLDDWAQGLKTVTYHAKLGTIADKVERITALALRLADTIGADKKLVERAAHLCKADLVTGMVGEFPELQGVMGRYYAYEQNENPAVAEAIADHYKPQGPNDTVPTNPVSICVALADKLDTLISMFAIGEKPTGSKDPFALRRAALGVIRIILENNLRLPLKPIFSKIPVKQIATLKAHEQLVHKTEAGLKNDVHKVGKYQTINETACAEITEDNVSQTSQALYEFFIDRLKVQLKDQGIRHDVISAIVADGDDDLVRIVARTKAIQEFIATDDGANLLAGYKRATNILTIEEKKDNKNYTYLYQTQAASTEGMISILTEEEKQLTSAFKELSPEIIKSLQNERFAEAMLYAAKIRSHVDTFFEKVMINDKDANIRLNRLHILSQLRIMLNKIADFSKIEGDVKELKKAA